MTGTVDLAQHSCGMFLYLGGCWSWEVSVVGIGSLVNVQHFMRRRLNVLSSKKHENGLPYNNDNALRQEHNILIIACGAVLIVRYLWQI